MNHYYNYNNINNNIDNSNIENNNNNNDDEYSDNNDKLWMKNKILSKLSWYRASGGRHIGAYICYDLSAPMKKKKKKTAS